MFHTNNASSAVHSFHMMKYDYLTKASASITNQLVLADAFTGGVLPDET